MNASHNLVSPPLPSSRLALRSACAAKVIDVVPAVMCCIHTEIRQQKSTHLTIPQIRALAFLETNNYSSLTELAEYLGVTSASASTMIERLVHKEYVSRTEHPKLRRQVVICLTTAGEEHLQEVRQITRDRLADKLADLPSDLLTNLINGLEELNQIFV
ncbi:MAG: MarR family transcriptional regulator [Pseudanabaena frigida]|uniref:MarR family transcriptional regulator n=1 Tax=Pseudanabaena frigida TaxID=945775 RepID=A0A2W4WJ60_9CYAN|nr:MAG: MarR family transcriptional regulator [Pseudanabaena frigida]